MSHTHTHSTPSDHIIVIAGLPVHAEYKLYRTNKLSDLATSMKRFAQKKSTRVIRHIAVLKRQYNVVSGDLLRGDLFCDVINYCPSGFDTGNSKLCNLQNHVTRRDTIHSSRRSYTYASTVSAEYVGCCLSLSPRSVPLSVAWLSVEELSHDVERRLCNSAQCVCI